MKYIPTARVKKIQSYGEQRLSTELLFTTDLSNCDFLAQRGMVMSFKIQSWTHQNFLVTPFQKKDAHIIRDVLDVSALEERPSINSSNRTQSVAIPIITKGRYIFQQCTEQLKTLRFLSTLSLRLIVINQIFLTILIKYTVLSSLSFSVTVDCTVCLDQRLPLRLDLDQHGCSIPPTESYFSFGWFS